MQEVNPIALFRISVLGPLVCRDQLERGELINTINELASYRYNIPNSKKSHICAHTIELWYYRWKSGGLDALVPKLRSDRGQSKLPNILQETIISLKKENPQRSIDTIINLLKSQGVDGAQSLSNSSVHRLLLGEGLSHIRKAYRVERRRFEGNNVDERWYKKIKTDTYADEIWLRKLLQGKLQLDTLAKDLYESIPEDDLAKLYDCVLNRPLRYRNRAVCVLAVYHGIARNLISYYLFISLSAVDYSVKSYRQHGTDLIVSDCKHKITKCEKQEYIDKLFSIFHSPPSSHGFNRTTWRLVDLKIAMELSGMPIDKTGIAKIIKNAGYSYRKAKTTLTSNDPDYKQKLAGITKILSGLKENEKFFSIDEYGPFAIKIQGGKSLVPAGTYKSVPQWQKNKGSLILTAALELSTNQITHFYSEKKNTEEMIKLLNVLLNKYSEEKTIYFSWDAASWHASKDLNKAVDKINSPEYRKTHKCPEIVLAPLPTCAQFLNVIESVFSGMARAIIHNSNYQSVEECKEAIDKYYEERNGRFLKNPKRAGNKIWGKERVKASFSESNNCKDPKYR